MRNAAQSVSQDPSTLELRITHCFERSNKSQWSGRKYFVQAVLGHTTKQTKAVKAQSGPPEFNERFELCCPESSLLLRITLYRERTVQFLKPQLVGVFEDSVSALLLAVTKEGTISRSLPPKTGLFIQFSINTPSHPTTNTPIVTPPLIEQTSSSASTVVASATPSSVDIKEIPSQELSSTAIVQSGKDAIASLQTLFPTDAPDPSSQALLQGRLWEPLFYAIGVLRELSFAVSELNPCAKVGVAAVFAIYDKIDGQVKLDEDVKELFESFCTFDDIVSDVKAMDLKPGDKRREVLVQMGRRLEQVIRDVCKYCERTGFMGRVVSNLFSDAKRKVQDHHKALVALKEEFYGRTHVQTSIQVAHVVKGIDQQAAREILNQIPYAPGAGPNKDKRCLQGTRVEFLKQICNWVLNPDCQPRLLLILGGAGMGKSTVAHSIAERFGHQLGSMFCFSRDAQTRTAKFVFPHLARDLADVVPGFAAALVKVVDVQSKRTQEALGSQFDDFIMTPAQSINKDDSDPIVIVIDALDEAGTDNIPQELLDILCEGVKKLPPRFRVIVTSRPENPIEELVDQNPDIHVRRMDNLSNNSEDITHYITFRLSNRHGSLLKGMSPLMCQTLARLSEGLFQWANLACGLIATTEGGKSRVERYHELVTSVQAGKGLGGDAKLDVMYDFVLSKSFSRQDQTVIHRFKQVMARVLMALEPLSMASLDEIIRHSDTAQGPVGLAITTAILPYLGSVLSGVNDSSSAIRPLHTSFRDFLTTPSRSKEFYVDIHSTFIQTDMAASMIRIMKKELKFNICNLKSSYLPNDNQEGVEKSIATAISPHLWYACRFWADHLPATNVDGDGEGVVKLNGELGIFLRTSLLHWLEVLSLKQGVSKAHVDLRKLLLWLEETDADSDDVAFATDAKLFVWYFANCIATSVPHIYLSAIPFTPKQSLVGLQYGGSLRRGIKVEIGRLEDWPDSLYVMKHSSNVNSVAFSPDGTHIVSGSWDNTVKIWNAADGTLVGKPFRGHTSCVNSVAFSPDGTHIVSGSWDKTVQVWKAIGGILIAEPFKGHTDSINSVAFSPDGTRVVSGSSDKTIRVWSALDGTPVAKPFQGHTWAVNSVAFSPDGTRIVSSSWDKTIRVWCATSGAQLVGPLNGHSDSVTSASFSPDGARVVSCSWDKTIRVWDASNGTLVAGPFKGHTDYVNSVAFSPDGARIVSGSEDSTVRFWNAVDGSTAGKTLQGHIMSVSAVAFSSDGTRVISGSKDNTVRVWVPARGTAAHKPFSGHTGHIHSISFSPDSSRIVSGSSDYTIRIWNADNGTLVMEPLRGHTSWVYSVKFSPDGTRIASSSMDKTIRIWNATDGTLATNPFRGHTNQVECVAFSPDGTRIASGSFDSTLRVWNAADGTLLAEPFQTNDRIVSVSFSPDGTRIVSGLTDSRVIVWDAFDGTPLAEFHGHTWRVNSVMFSPDATLIVSCSGDSSFRVWNAHDGSLALKPFHTHTEPVFSTSFSPDGTRIVSGSWDKTVQLHNVADGSAVARPFEGHSKAVLSVAFSPDGTRFASSSEDCTIRIWNAVIKAAPLRSLQETTPASDTAQSPPDDANIFSEESPDSLPPPLFDPYLPAFNDQSHPNEDGWVLGPHDELLFWVPLIHRQNLWSPSNTLIIGENSTKLNFANFSHGLAWSEGVSCII